MKKKKRNKNRTLKQNLISCFQTHSFRPDILYVRLQMSANVAAGIFRPSPPCEPMWEFRRKMSGRFTASEGGRSTPAPPLTWMLHLLCSSCVNGNTPENVRIQFSRQMESRTQEKQTYEAPPTLPRSTLKVHHSCLLDPQCCDIIQCCESGFDPPHLPLILQDPKVVSERQPFFKVTLVSSSCINYQSSGSVANISQGDGIFRYVKFTQ